MLYLVLYLVLEYKTSLCPEKTIVYLAVLVLAVALLLVLLYW